MRQVTTASDHSHVAGFTNLTHSDLEELKILLESELAAIHSRYDAVRATGSINFDTNERADEVDSASQLSCQTAIVSMLDRDYRLEREVKDALRRIESGDYGYCEATGKTISKRRLFARPWSRYCVTYQESLEKRKKSWRGFVDEDI